MLFVRGFAAGVVATGLCGFTAYRVASHAGQQPSQPHIEYQEQRSRQQEIMKYGTPRRSPEVSVYKNHALCYDQQRRIPHWVAEHITRDKIKGKADRKNSKFQPDPAVPVLFQADNDDYHKSGWSRGHMAPAGNSKYDQDAMNETFLLTNIVPQDADNNSGFWNRFETYCRDLATKHDNVWVISGPVFLPTTVNDKGKQKKFIRHEVIGAHDVAVPTHLFKVLVVENEKDGRPSVGAFLVPNEPISNEHKLREFQVPLETIESRTGLYMLPLLDRKKARDLCTVDSCRVQTYQEFMLQRINYSRSLKQLAQITDRDLQADKQLIAAYEAKRKELQSSTAAARAHG